MRAPPVAAAAAALLLLSALISLLCVMEAGAASQLTVIAGSSSPEEVAAADLRLEGTMSPNGPQTVENQAIYFGAFLWRDWINAQGGIPLPGGGRMVVSVVMRDDTFSHDAMREGISEMCSRPAEERPHGIIGSFSSTSTVVYVNQMVAVRAAGNCTEVPLIAGGAASPAPFSAALAGGLLMLSSVPPATAWFHHLMDLVVVEHGARTFGLFVDTADAFSNSIAGVARLTISNLQETYPDVRLLMEEDFEQSSGGGSRVSHTLRLLDATQHMKEANPDVVLVSGQFEDTVTIMQAMELKGFRPKAAWASLFLGSEDTFESGQSWMTSSLFEPSMGYGPADDLTYMGNTDDFCAFLNTTVYASGGCNFYIAGMVATLLVAQVSIEATGEFVDSDDQRTALNAIDMDTFYGPLKLDSLYMNGAKKNMVVQVQGENLNIVFPRSAPVRTEPVYPMPNPPTTPSSLSTLASSESAAAVVVDWVAEHAGSHAQHFLLEVAPETEESWSTAYNGTGTITTVVLSSTDTIVRFRVRAVNAAGASEWSAVVKASAGSADADSGSSTTVIVVVVVVCIVVIIGGGIGISVLYRHKKRMLKQVILHEITTAGKNQRLNLESPTSKAITVLRSLKDDPAFRQRARELDGVIDTLMVSQAQAYNPDIDHETTDEEVNHYLHQLLHITRKNGETSKMSMQSRDSGGSKKKLGGGKGLLSKNAVAPRRSTVMLDQASSSRAMMEESLHRWDFNVFKFARVADGMPLSHMAMFLFDSYSLTETFAIDEQRLNRWLVTMEKLYHADNPYHNSTHAADVLHACHVLSKEETVNAMFTQVERFILLVSALVHDVNHPGLTNTFLCNTREERALLYNDRSVLENHHSYLMFKTTLGNEDIDIFANLDEPMYARVRKGIIDSVLATDVSQHFLYVEKFKNRVQAGGLDNSPECALLTSQMILKAADVSNPAKPTHLASEWTARIMDEFFVQGDRERALDTAISMFMDRGTTNIPKCQLGFISFIVQPCFQALALQLPVDLQLQHIDQNTSFWTDREKEVIEKSSSTM